MSDLIDRQEAIDAIKREQAYYAPEDGAEIFYEYNHAIKALKNLPSAQPEPDWNEMIVICDCCGHAIQVKREADMRGEENE